MGRSGSDKTVETVGYKENSESVSGCLPVRPQIVFGRGTNKCEFSGM